jgi:hypothetical protein
VLSIDEWLLESNFSAEEEASLTAVLVDEFKASPAEAAKNYAASHLALPKIVGASPVDQVTRRAEMW